MNIIHREQIETVWHPFVQMNKYKELPLIIVEGDGVKVKDETGKEYIDAISSLWNVSCGHGNPKIINKIIEQFRQIEFFSLFGYSNRPSIELAIKLKKLTKSRFNHFFFTNSGSEGIDTALKIVRQYHHNIGSGKHKIISLHRAYHGMTFGALSACGISSDTRKFQPLLDGFRQIYPAYCYRCYYQKENSTCDLYCVEQLIRMIEDEKADTVAGLICEPILGAGGILVPPNGYFQRIKEICNHYDLILIMDEVSTGFGRVGEVLGSDHWEITPDIFVGAKGITSGYLPLGVVGVNEKIYNAFLGELEEEKHLNHGFTSSGHPVCCQAASATLDYINDNNLIEQVRKKGKLFARMLSELNELSIVGDIRGLGMMWGLELVKDKQSKERIDKSKNINYMFYEIARRKGLLSYPTAGNVISFFPPLISTEEILQEIVDLIKQSLVLTEKYLSLA